MPNTTSLTVDERVQDLVRHIKEGRILDAMKEFYAEDTQMQENRNPPTVGLAANIEREKQFLRGVKHWKGSEFKAIGVGKNVTFYEAEFDWVTTDGVPVHIEQIAVQRWRDGKIIHERFYHDTGGPTA